MAQSQVSAPWLDELGGATSWGPTGGVGEQPIDIWSRLPETHITEPSTAAPHNAFGNDIGQVLAAWRAAERRLEGLVEASPMRFVVLSEIDRLRAEYQRLVARATR